MIVVNLLGASGVGKSTLAHEIYVNLAKNNVNVEFVSEPAKILYYAGTLKPYMSYQVVKSMYNNLEILSKSGEVDVAVCEGSLLLSILYAGKFDIEKFVNHYYDDPQFDHLNVLCPPNRKFYKPEGRNEKSFEVIEEYHNKLLKLLAKRENFTYITRENIEKSMPLSMTKLTKFLG